MVFNQIYNIMNVKEFCLSFYVLSKFHCASGSKPPYVTHSTKETLSYETYELLSCYFKKFWTFKSISLKTIDRTCFLSSNTFFGDCFLFLACLISIRCFDLNVQMMLSLRLLDLKCFIAAEFSFTEAYFPVS